MKPKKLYKHWKEGTEWKNGILWDVARLRKRMAKKRTCRLVKHKLNTNDLI